MNLKNSSEKGSENEQKNETNVNFSEFKREEKEEGKTEAEEPKKEEKRGRKKGSGRPKKVTELEKWNAEALAILHIQTMNLFVPGGVVLIKGRKEALEECYVKLAQKYSEYIEKWGIEISILGITFVIISDTFKAKHETEEEIKQI